MLRNRIELNKILDDTCVKVGAWFEKVFPNLRFFISHNGDITIWVKTSDGSSGAGISLDKHYNAYSDYDPERDKTLEAINKKVEKAHTDAKHYFYCTECGQVKPRSEFADSIFASYYCKDCAKKPEIAERIKESHKDGFYD